MGISDLKVVADPAVMLVTHSLGSCVAVTAWCPRTKVSGMLHFQLPEASMDPRRADQSPLMFGDSGIERLVAEVARLGGDARRLEIKLAGGAKMLSVGSFDIGHRNHLSARKQVWKHGLFVAAEDCGGTNARTLYLRCSDGAARLRVNGAVKPL